jgi:CRP/FNR family transcriptional regulator, anaerobic regulatory protein
MMNPSALAKTLRQTASPEASGSRFPATDHCRVVQGGGHLFQVGETSQDAYLIRSGNLKRYTVYPDGEEQILGIHGPGDVVGFHALFEIPAQSSVVALDTAHVQILPLLRKSMLDADGAGSAQVAVQAMYQELLRMSRQLHMERHPTERRLAEFLLDYSEHQRLRGLCRDRLILPVSRRDLARFLGLAPETLSRTLSLFQSRDLIELDNREVMITGRQGLEILASG